MAMETAGSRLRTMKPVGHLMVACLLFYTALVTTLPFMVDVLLGAICPGKTECPQVIVLMGAQQLVVGVGTVVLAPILGGISDDYGRKPIFTVILFAAIIPPVLLAYSRSELFVYIWFPFMMLVATLTNGGLIPGTLAYVADVVDESRRSSAVGLSMASISVGFLAGTVAALIIKTAAQAYIVAAILQICAAIYLELFVKETHPRQHHLPAEQLEAESRAKLLSKRVLTRQTTNLRETGKAVWTSPRLRTIALIDFMNSFGTTGLQSFALYYLKSRFDYGKNEYAILVIIAALGVAFGQMFIYPLLSHLFGERGVLWIGLLGAASHYFIYGLAWAPWVPYLAGGMAVFSAFITPAVGTMVSRGVDRDQQGKVQGFMGGLRSAAAIVAPLVLTPLTAAALGEHPPLNLRGLPFLICGASMVVALLIALAVPPLPPPQEKETDYIQAPLPPEDFIHVTAPPEDLLHVPIHPETVDVVNADKDDKDVLES